MSNNNEQTTPVEEEILTETEEVETEAVAEVAENDEMQQKYDELNDRLLRTLAEYDNFRKRSQREREQVHADAVMYAVKALLPIYDNLGRALAQPTEDVEYKKGIEMTFNQLVENLATLNVKPIEATIGSEFDPNLHNAVMHIENDALGENVIAEVFQQGFTIGDKVIRHAMVQVAN